MTAGTNTPWKQGGFTLIEVIISLVLLGILGSVAVPKMIDLVTDSRKKAGLSAINEVQTRIDLGFSAELLKGKNCKDATAVVRELVYLTDNTNSVGEYTVGEKSGTAGGTFLNGKNKLFAWLDDDTKNAVRGDVYVPVCGEMVPPDAEGDAPSMGDGEHVDMSEAALKILLQYFEDINQVIDTVDSEAGDGAYHLPKIRQLMWEAGIDLDALGIRSWSYENVDGHDFMHWTAVDISKCNSGDKVLCMRWNGNLGTYTVGYATVKEVTNKGHKYNVLDKPSKGGTGYFEGVSEGVSDFDTAKKIYDENYEATKPAPPKEK